MASITADLATTFLTLTARHRTPLSRVQATVLPFLLSPATPQPRSFRFTTSSFHSRIIAVDFSKPKGCSRRLTVAASASATTTPQSEGSDVSTKIPPDNRVPATIITGFLGSGKVCACINTPTFLSFLSIHCVLRNVCAQLIYQSSFQSFTSNCFSFQRSASC